MMRKRLRSGWLLVWLVVAPVAFASAPPAGWEEILAQFDSYGLPNVSTATYVAVGGRWSEFESPLPDAWESPGNAWMLSESVDANSGVTSGLFRVNGGDIIEVERRRGESWTRPLPKDPLALPNMKVALPLSTWKTADPVQQARKAIRFLKALEWKPNADYELNERVRGRLFLLALGLHQQGDEATASELRLELEVRSGPTNDVVLDAMNQVANGQYETLYRGFRITHEWAAYRDGLRTLLERYPAGWRMEPEIWTLLERVEERLASSPPASTGAESLSKKEKRQAEQMLELGAIRTRQSRWEPSGVLWLLPSTWRSRAPKPMDLELEIRARGIDAMPFLLALADDGALTLADRKEVTGRPRYSSRKKHTYERMNRPATRGEVACRWLKEMLPESVQKELGNRPMDRRQMAAMHTFYEQHAKDREEALAILLLPGRTGKHNPRALDFLLGRARQASVPELEAYVLASPPKKKRFDYWDRHRSQARVDLARQYAAVRGEDARPFLKAFASQLRRDVEAGLIPKEHDALRDAEALADFPYGYRVERELDGTLENDGLTNSSIGLAREAQLRSMPDEECYRLLLVGAAREVQAARQPFSAYLLHGMMKDRLRKNVRPTEHAAEWDVLLSDAWTEKNEGGRKRMADDFLKLNEHLFASPVPEGDRGGYSSWQGASRLAELVIEEYGDLGREWVRERVRQRLAGIPEAQLPPYPDTAIPDEAALVSLGVKFAAVEDRAAAAAVVGGLTLPERVALPAFFRQNPDLDTKLGRDASVITRVRVDEGMEEWGDTFGEWKGRLPAPELFEAMRNVCKARAGAEEPATCKLSRLADFGGCELVVEARTRMKPLPPERADKMRIVGFGGLVCARDLYAVAVWRMAPPAEEVKRWHLKTSGEYDLRRFENALEEWCDFKMPANSEALVVFQTREDFR